MLHRFKLRIECYGMVGKDKQSSTATLGDTVISQGISDMLQELTNVAFLDQPPIAGEGFEFTDMVNL